MLVIAKLAMRSPVIGAGVATALLLGMPIPMVLLSIFGSPLSSLMLVASGAVVTLVMLRLGEAGTLRVVLIGTVCLLVVWLLTGGGIIQALLMSLLFWCIPAGAGWVLRTSVRLDLALLAAALAVALLLLAVFIVYGNPELWWRGVAHDFLTVVNQAMEQRGAGQAVTTDGPLAALTAEQQAMIDRMAPLMTGAVAASGFSTMVAAVLLARSWQAGLYNPGGFQPEFHRLAFGKMVTLAGAAVIAAAWATSWPVLVAAALLVGAVFMFQGIAVAHALVKRHGMSRGWLVGMYILLGQIAILLVALGMLDNWLNLRRQNNSTGN